MDTVNLTPRWIPLEGAANARAVVPGALLRSDNLQELTPRDVRMLVDEHALEVVLDLRTEVEVQLEGPGPMTAEPAVRIEHLSLYPESGGNTDLETETINPFAAGHGDDPPGEPPLVRAYMGYLRRRPDSIVQAIRAIACSERAVLVHCAAGKDRTGVVVALALDAAGVDREAIVADYLATGERAEAVIARLLRSRTYQDELRGRNVREHTPVPENIERVFELIEERFGGVARWLSAHGLDATDQERLRQRLAPEASGDRDGSLQS